MALEGTVVRAGQDIIDEAAGAEVNASNLLENLTW
jgi:hypothetical protein